MVMCSKQYGHGVVFGRWLVKKHREQEALMALSKINRHSSKETFVDTYLELEALRESLTQGKSAHLMKDLCQCKNIYRYDI